MFLVQLSSFLFVAIWLQTLVLGVFSDSLFCNMLVIKGYISLKSRLPILETYRLPLLRPLVPLDLARRTRVLAPL